MIEICLPWFLNCELLAELQKWLSGCGLLNFEQTVSRVGCMQIKSLVSALALLFFDILKPNLYTNYIHNISVNNLFKE